MAQKFKNIISLIMVLTMLMPTILKLEHHHEHFVCNATSEKHFHNYHEKCAVCSFEFSVFLSDKINIFSVKDEETDNYNSHLNVSYYSNYSKYSFLLRAPPVFTNNL